MAQGKRRGAQMETPEALSEQQETVSVSEHCHRLPREIADSLSLEILKSHQDMVLGYLL